MGECVIVERTKPLTRFSVPFNKEVEIFEVIFDNHSTLLRARIKEGRRFTIIDLDPITAQIWGEAMCNWARLNVSEQTEN